MSLATLQPRVYQMFERLLSQGKVSHAYLFSGDFASFEMAQLLAQTFFCQEKVADFACGHCRTCKAIAEGDFPDVKLVEPIGQLIKTEQIRDLLADFSRSGLEGSQQVFIIRDSDKMHINAANSLLKMIEEPTAQVRIFLLTSDESKILATIKSRCQIVHFPPNRAYLAQVLEEAGLLKTQAKVLAQLAKDPADAKMLANNSKLLDLLKASQRFINQWKIASPTFYLEVARLCHQATDKKEQEQVLQLLTILLGQEEKSLALADKLDQLHQARVMWQANVSLQNALDYLAIRKTK